MMRKPIQFTANLQSSMISFATHEDREYIVAPCVALVPHVLNDDLVTLEAVANTYQAWNGRPAVLNHPLDADGLPTSANDPSVLAHSGVGYVWNADINDNRLRVQVWLDVGKCVALGGDARRVLDAVKAGDHIEVSTGYWATMRARRGVHRGRAYNSTTELIIPDHLAMLPNALGACSWGDGCGIPRTNQQKDLAMVTNSRQSRLSRPRVMVNADQGLEDAAARRRMYALQYVSALEAKRRANAVKCSCNRSGACQCGSEAAQPLKRPQALVGPDGR
jgi:uncharacterized protein DUF2213